jgi:hypothetical protein
MGEAARALNLPNFNIISPGRACPQGVAPLGTRNYILRNQQKPYKGRYSLKKK